MSFSEVFRMLNTRAIKIGSFQEHTRNAAIQLHRLFKDKLVTQRVLPEVMTHLKSSEKLASPSSPENLASFSELFRKFHKRAIRKSLLFLERERKLPFQSPDSLVAVRSGAGGKVSFSFSGSFEELEEFPRRSSDLP